MPLVKESTDFKNSYSDLSDFCHKYQEPVIITRNIESDIAAMSIKTYVVRGTFYCTRWIRGRWQEKEVIRE
jgi:hypothetical protein